MVGLNSYDQCANINFVPADNKVNGVSLVHEGKSVTLNNTSSSRLPQIKFELQSSRRNDFLQTDDDAISRRFESISKPSKRQSGSIIFNKAKRNLPFDKISKPKYPSHNVHHYTHDPTFNQTWEAKGSMIEFANQTRRSKELKKSDTLEELKKFESEQTKGYTHKKHHSKILE